MDRLYSDQERAASDYSNRAFGPQLKSYHLHCGLVFWVWGLKFFWLVFFWGGSVCLCGGRGGFVFFFVYLLFNHLEKSINWFY